MKHLHAIGLRAATLALALNGHTLDAHAQSLDLRRGPPEIRDEQLLAQPRLTLPACSTATLAPGAWSVNLDTLWSNTFNWDQDFPGEGPERRSYLIDGEALAVAATLRHGLRPGWDVGLRLPVRWRGGGLMDGLIDNWHEATRLPNGSRPAFLTNAFRVAGRLQDGRGFSWTRDSGSGLGNLELETRWRFADTPSASAAVVGRVALPTGTGSFAGHATAAGVQFLVDAPLAGSLDVYGGVGGTVQGRGPVESVEYEPARVHGFLALEWRPWRSLSLIAETNAASRLVSNIEAYPGVHWMLDVSARRSLGGSSEITLGFSENLASQLTTTDFALYASVSIRR